MAFLEKRQTPQSTIPTPQTSSPRREKVRIEGERTDDEEARAETRFYQLRDLGARGNIVEEISPGKYITYQMGYPGPRQVHEPFPAVDTLDFKPVGETSARGIDASLPAGFSTLPGGSAARPVQVRPFRGIGSDAEKASDGIAGGNPLSKDPISLEVMKKWGSPGDLGVDGGQGDGRPLTRMEKIAKSARENFYEAPKALFNTVFVRPVQGLAEYEVYSQMPQGKDRDEALAAAWADLNAVPDAGAAMKKVIETGFMGKLTEAAAEAANARDGSLSPEERRQAAARGKRQWDEAWDGVKHRADEDPVGLTMDVAGVVLGGAGTIARGVGGASKLTRTAALAQRTQALNRASQLTRPMQVTAREVQLARAAQLEQRAAQAQRVMQGAKRGEDIVETIAKVGMNKIVPKVVAKATPIIQPVVQRVAQKAVSRLVPGARPGDMFRRGSGARASSSRTRGKRSALPDLQGGVGDFDAQGRRPRSSQDKVWNGNAPFISPQGTKPTCGPHCVETLLNDLGLEADIDEIYWEMGQTDIHGNILPEKVRKKIYLPEISAELKRHGVENFWDTMPGGFSTEDYIEDLMSMVEPGRPPILVTLGELPQPVRQTAWQKALKLQPRVAEGQRHVVVLDYVDKDPVTGQLVVGIRDSQLGLGNNAALKPGELTKTGIYEETMESFMKRWYLGRMQYLKLRM